MRPFRTSWITMLVAVGALVLTACNGNGNDEAAPEEPAPVAPDGQPAPEAPPQDMDPNECAVEYAELFAAENAYTGEMTQLMSGQADDPAPTMQALQEMANAAPSELSAEFQVLADELSVYVQAAADQGLFEFDGEPTEEQVEAMQQLDDQIDVAAIEDAQTTIDEYFTENC